MAFATKEYPDSRTHCLAFLLCKSVEILTRYSSQFPVQTYTSIISSIVQKYMIILTNIFGDKLICNKALSPGANTRPLTKSQYFPT